MSSARPGENLGSAVDAGTAHYLFGDGAANALLKQDTTGVPSAPETDDRVGYSVAASPCHIAVGGPGEASGTDGFAGIVHVFRHVLSAGTPTYLADLSQDTSGISGAPGPGDLFGRSISMAPFRPVGAPPGQPDPLLVVGVPGGDFTSSEHAGMVQRPRNGSARAASTMDVSRASNDQRRRARPAAVRSPRRE